MYTVLFVVVTFLILAYLKSRTFRGFLLFGAFLVGMGINSCVASSHASHGRSPETYIVIPLVAVIVTNLTYLAFTNVRKLLVSVAILSVVMGLCWLIYEFAPLVGVIVLVWFFLAGLRASSGSESDFSKAVIVHSAEPSVSVGEAYGFLGLF